MRERVDLGAVDHDAVAAAQILDAHRLGADDEQRVLAGHERVVERQLAFGATPMTNSPWASSKLCWRWRSRKGMP